MRKEGESFKLGRRPALDGLRAVAVTLVVLSHAGFPRMARAGTVGVTMFFVLSGFLITLLLVEERGQVSRIDLRAFYVRRVLRLAPAMAALLVVVVPIAWLKGASMEPGVLTALYAANLGAASGVDMGMLAHTWSLSLEEQFYFVWPFALLALIRARAALPILSVVTLGSAALRISLWTSGATFDLTRAMSGDFG